MHLVLFILLLLFAIHIAPSVGNGNDAPVVMEDSAETDENTSVDIPVLSNDSDPDGDTLIIISTSTPNFGTVVIDNDKGIIEYTPNAAATAECDKCAGDIQDTFLYTIQDIDGNTATGPVTIDIECLICSRPVAVDDVNSTNEQTPIAINVLSNDRDPDSVGISVNDITNQPDIGSAVIVGNQIVYTPELAQDKCDEIATSANPDSFIDTLTYNIVTNSPARLVSADATVTIVVFCIRIPPIARDDTATVNEGQSVDIDVLDNDSDPDNNDTDSISIANITTNPSKGTAVINGDETITYTPDDICNQAPNLDKNTIIDTFKYTIIDRDENLISEPALVIIYIICNREPSKSSSRKKSWSKVSKSRSWKKSKESGSKRSGWRTYIKSGSKGSKGSKSWESWKGDALLIYIKSASKVSSKSSWNSESKSNSRSKSSYGGYSGSKSSSDTTHRYKTSWRHYWKK